MPKLHRALAGAILALAVTAGPAWAQPSVLDREQVEGTDPGQDTLFVVTFTDPSLAGTPTPTTCRFEYVVESGTATIPEDLIRGGEDSASGIAELGTTATSTFLSIPVVADALDEVDETFTVRIGDATCTPQGGTPYTVAPADAEGVGTIVDDDEPGPDPCTGTGAIVGTEAADFLVGTNGPDVICGLGGNDTVNGFAGNDTILGGDGTDRLLGTLGDDALDGGPGFDRLFGGRGDDAVTGGEGDDQLSGGAEADTLTDDAGDDVLLGSTGADTLTAGVGDDVLRGGDGADLLDGQQDDDRLYGEGGDDRLFGGSGFDLCVQGASAGFEIAEDCEAP